MARATNPLNNTQIDKAKSKPKEYTLSDGKGLYLLIKPNGAKLWQFNYYKPFTNPKKRILLGLGKYPDVSLQQARKTRDEYLALLAQGIDPQEHRQTVEQAKQAEIYNTFENVAWEWYEWRQTRANFSQSYAKDVKSLIERILLPAFSHLPITQITAPMALKAFKPLQERGTLETLKRAIQKLNEIMTYALHREIIPYNPTANLSKEFDSPTVTHFKAIKPEDLGVYLEQCSNPFTDPLFDFMATSYNDPPQ